MFFFRQVTWKENGKRKLRGIHKLVIGTTYEAQNQNCEDRELLSAMEKESYSLVLISMPNIYLDLQNNNEAQPPFVQLAEMSTDY